MRVVQLIVLVLLVINLAACSSKPSDAEAERLFNEQNQTSDFIDLFDFENVKRVNGYEHDGQRYVVEMQFDIVTKVDYQTATDAIRRRTSNDFIAQAQLSNNLATLEKEFGQFKKGARFTKKRPMVLKRTESGWALAQ